MNPSPLRLCCFRLASPRHGFTIMNRLSMENLTEPITKDLDFQLQDPFLLYRNARCKEDTQTNFFCLPVNHWCTHAFLCRTFCSEHLWSTAHTICSYHCKCEIGFSWQLYCSATFSNKERCVLMQWYVITSHNLTWVSIATEWINGGPKCPPCSWSEWDLVAPYKEHRYPGEFYQPDSSQTYIWLTHTHADTQTRCRMCLRDRSLTALQNQPAEIRYTTTVTDNLNTHTHTLTNSEIADTHRPPSLSALTLSIRLSKRQVECSV